MECFQYFKNKKQAQIFNLGWGPINIVGSIGALIFEFLLNTILTLKEMPLYTYTYVLYHTNRK